MPSNRVVLSAGTSFANTPESDSQRTVLHDVTVKLGDGKYETVQIRAEAPDTAIERVRTMSDAVYAGLRRVED